MPSVFTIDGTSTRKRRRKARKSTASHSKLGDCKAFSNPKTGLRMVTCFVGKSKSSPTGWRIQKLNSARKRR